MAEKKRVTINLDVEPGQTIMTINLDVATGQLISVLKNGDEVRETKEAIALRGISPNPHLVIPSHSSPGCITYVFYGRPYVV